MTRFTELGVPPQAQRVIKFATALAARRDVSAWYAALSRIHRESVMHDLDLHVDHPNLRVVKGPNWAGFVQIGGPYADFAANLVMSDEALTEMFLLWLQVARKRVPAPRTTRGKKALNSYLDERTFARWRDARIVEYAHLLIWWAKLDPSEKDKYSVKTRADWIERGMDENGRGEKKLRVTREVLRHAMSCLPMLGGQRELELLKAEDALTRKALAERIEKDVSRDRWAARFNIKQAP